METLEKGLYLCILQNMLVATKKHIKFNYSGTWQKSGRRACGQCSTWLSWRQFPPKKRYFLIFIKALLPNHLDLSFFGFTAYLDPVDGEPINAVVEGGESERSCTNLIVGTLLQVPDL